MVERAECTAENVMVLRHTHAWRQRSMKGLMQELMEKVR